MKKLLSSMLIVLLLICSCTSALAAKAGDTVTISLTVTGTSNGAMSGDATLSYDRSALEFVEAVSGALVANGNGFSLLDLQGIKVGATVTLKFKVKDGAKPGQTYSVSVGGGSFFNEMDEAASVSFSGGSVTIESAACTTHKWDAGKVTKDASCKEAGVKTYTCTACGETKTEAIAKKAHTEVTDKAVAATCTKTGLTEGKHCSVCGTVTVKQETVAKKAHTEVTDKAVAATCTKTGLTEGKHCSVCGTVTVKQETVAKKAHTPGKATVSKEATCTETGLQSYTCTVCGTKIKDEVIPKKAHTEVVDKAVAATCTKTGLTEGKHCSVCGAVTVKQETVAKKAHTYGAAKVTKEATCTAKGEKVSTCTVCGDKKAEEIPMKAHTEVTDKAVAATCTKTGLTEGKHCSVCNKVLVKQEVVAKKAHTPGEWEVVKPAENGEDGLEERKCTVCGTVVESKVIEGNKVSYFWNNTACSVGPAFRDVSNLTSKWHRFTPVDLSENGTQTFDLMGSNMYIIGKVTVTVQDGYVTVDCQYSSVRVNVKKEFCTFLPSLAETTTLDQDKLTNYAFGTPISIADDLGGDTKVLLYICNLIDYDSSMNVIYQAPTEKDFLEKTNAMKELMD